MHGFCFSWMFERNYTLSDDRSQYLHNKADIKQLNINVKCPGYIYMSNILYVSIYIIYYY